MAGDISEAAAERTSALPTAPGSVPGVVPAETAARIQQVVAASHSERDALVRRLLALADACGIGLALGLLALLSPARDGAVLWAIVLATLPIWLAILKSYGLYDRDAKRMNISTIDEVPKLFHAFLVGGLMTWIGLQIEPGYGVGLIHVLIFAVVGLPAVALLRVAARRGEVALLGPERLLLVGDGEDLAVLARKLRAHAEYGVTPVGFISRTETSAAVADLPVLGHAVRVDLAEVVASHRVERVLVAHREMNEAAMLDLIRRCRELKVKVTVVPQLFDAMGPSVEIDDVEGITVLGLNPPVLPRSSRLLKRTLDLVGAVLLLIAAAPLIAAIALAIRLDSRGPIFFRQTRVGRGGEPFRLVKFRSMGVDAEARRAELMAMSRDPGWLLVEDDPRVTRVGRFLRLTSLDELPQLWNVLKGEMSLVGPRPLIESEDSQLSGWRRSRIDLTPGLTGLWQVLGRTAIPFDEMIKLDYLYVTNWSLWNDVRLILRTIPAVFLRRGAN